jgi:hypothetical protein
VDTEAKYRASQQGACHGVGCYLRDGNDFWPAGEAVDYSEAVRVARRRRKGSREVYMNVQETYCRRCKLPSGVTVWREILERWQDW